MSSGRHKTSAIARPKPPRGADDADHSRFADFTRPIQGARQLVQRKGNRWLLGVLALVVVASLLGALFVLPVQAWLRQEDDLASKRAQLEILAEANAQLQTDVERLRTEEGAKEAARDELGLVAPGEIRISMLDVAEAPVQLPPGWPYDAVTQIVAIRTKQAAPPTTVIPEATVVPTTVTPTTVMPTTVAPASTPVTAPATSAP